MISKGAEKGMKDVTRGQETREEEKRDGLSVEIERNTRAIFQGKCSLDKRGIIPDITLKLAYFRRPR